jgi:hypothetical protein
VGFPEGVNAQGDQRTEQEPALDLELRIPLDLGTRSGVM